MSGLQFSPSKISLQIKQGNITTKPMEKKKTLTEKHKLLS
jgi:hypothetical protein